MSGVAVRIWLEDCAEPCLMTFPAAPSPGDVIRVKWDGAQRTQRVRHVEWVIVYTDVDLNVVCEKP